MDYQPTLGPSPNTLYINKHLIQPRVTSTEGRSEWLGILETMTASHTRTGMNAHMKTYT